MNVLSPVSPFLACRKCLRLQDRYSLYGLRLQSSSTSYFAVTSILQKVRHSNSDQFAMASKVHTKNDEPSTMETVVDSDERPHGRVAYPVTDPVKCRLILQTALLPRCGHVDEYRRIASALVSLIDVPTELREKLASHVILIKEHSPEQWVASFIRVCFDSDAGNRVLYEAVKTVLDQKMYLKHYEHMLMQMVDERYTKKPMDKNTPSTAILRCYHWQANANASTKGGSKTYLVRAWDTPDGVLVPLHEEWLAPYASGRNLHWVQLFENTEPRRAPICHCSYWNVDMPHAVLVSIIESMRSRCLVTTDGASREQVLQNMMRIGITPKDAHMHALEGGPITLSALNGYEDIHAPVMMDMPVRSVVAPDESLSIMANLNVQMENIAYSIVTWPRLLRCVHASALGHNWHKHAATISCDRAWIHFMEKPRAFSFFGGRNDNDGWSYFMPWADVERRTCTLNSAEISTLCALLRQDTWYETRIAQPLVQLILELLDAAESGRTVTSADGSVQHTLRKSAVPSDLADHVDTSEVYVNILDPSTVEYATAWVQNNPSGYLWPTRHDYARHTEERICCASRQHIALWIRDKVLRKTLIDFCATEPSHAIKLKEHCCLVYIGLIRETLKRAPCVQTLLGDKSWSTERAGDGRPKPQCAELCRRSVDSEQCFVAMGSTERLAFERALQRHGCHVVSYLYSTPTLQCPPLPALPFPTMLLPSQWMKVPNLCDQAHAPHPGDVWVQIGFGDSTQRRMIDPQVDAPSTFVEQGAAPLAGQKRPRTECRPATYPLTYPSPPVPHDESHA